MSDSTGYCPECKAETEHVFDEGFFCKQCEQRQLGLEQENARLREQLATEQQRHGVVIDDFQQQLRIVAKEREEIDRLRKQIKAADELAAAVASVEGCNFTHSFYDHLMSKMDAYRASRGQA